MTFAQIYAEIIKRAGEGYDAYLDRAEECFWKAVSDIINAGEFTDTEIRMLSNRYTAAINKSDLVSGLYNILKIWHNAPNPNPAYSPFYLNEVFMYRVELTPISPWFMKFTQVSSMRIKDAHILGTLSTAAGISELIWAFDYPQLIVNTINVDQSNTGGDYRVLLNLATYSIPKTVKSNSATNADGYMNYSFVIRAIEKAVSILKTETE